MSLHSLAALTEIIEAAYAEGHAEALEMCAHTDEQRLRALSDASADIAELVSVCRDVLDLLSIDLRDMSIADAERCMLRQVIAKHNKPRPVQVLPLADCKRLAEKSQKMQAEYRSECECARNAGQGIPEEDFQTFHSEEKQ